MLEQIIEKYCQGNGIEFGEDASHLTNAPQIRDKHITIDGNVARVTPPDSLDIFPSSLDFIVCNHFLEHYTNIRRILLAWKRVLKPEGYLVLILPYAGIYPKLGEPGCNPDHKHDFTPSIIRQILSKNWIYFEVVEEHTIGDSFLMVIRNKKHPEETDFVPVSVIIPFTGDTKLVRNCVASVLATFNPQEIICIANGATSKFTHPSRIVKVITYPDRIGFPRAVNRGVKEASCPFIVVLNDDVEIHKSGLQRLVKALKDPSVAMAGQTGGLLDEDMSFLKQTRENPHYIEMYCCAFRKSVWEVVGPLDEGFSPGYCEDSDWGIRATKLGYKLAIVRNVCTHFGGMTFANFPDKEQLIARNTIKLRQKHKKGRCLWVIASANISGGIKVINNLAAALLNDGWDVSVYCMSGWKNAPSFWDKFRKVEKHDISPPYDIVFSTFHSTMPLAVAVPAKEHIAIIQSDEPEWGIDLEADWNFRIPNFKHIIIAEHMWEFEQKYGMKILGKIDNGVDNLMFYPRWTFRREWPHKILVVLKGQKVRYDGFEYVEEAIPELRRRYADFSIVVLGFYKPNWDCPMEFYKTTDENEICNLYNSVSAVVKPSLIEGSSLVVLEAMASGCPVITTKIGVDYGIHEENVLFIPYKDSMSIVEAVSRIFEDEELRWRLYKNGLKVAEERTWERQQQQFLEIINNVMKEGRR